jgi:hypothetical protein
VIISAAQCESGHHCIMRMMSRLRASAKQSTLEWQQMKKNVGKEQGKDECSPKEVLGIAFFPRATHMIVY